MQLFDTGLMYGRNKSTSLFDHLNSLEIRLAYSGLRGREREANIQAREARMMKLESRINRLAMIPSG